MDKKWIEQAIKDNIDIVPGPEPATALLSYAKGAETIAAQHEADKADALLVQDQTWKDIEKGHLETIAALQAKVAGMEGALKAYQTMRENDGYTVRLSEIDALVGKALSEPQVLWSGQTRLDHYTTGAEMDIEMTEVLGSIPGHVGKDGSIADVILSHSKEE